MYKIEKASEAYDRIHQKMQDARGKISLPDREIYILRKIMLNSKNALSVCRSIWGDDLDLEDVVNYINLYYLHEELGYYRKEDSALFAQTYEIVDEELTEAVYEERVFYIFEKLPDYWGGSYIIQKLSATYPHTKLKKAMTDIKK